MPSRRGVLLFVSAAVAVLVAAPASGELNKRSPFLRPETPGDSRLEMRPALELRGITIMDGIARFSISEVERNRSVWVTLDEEGHSFVLKHYDAAGDRVTIEQAGRVFSLALRTAKIAATNSALAPRPVVAQSAFPGSSISDEARWRDAVTNEINRRLAVRAQANFQAGRL